VISVEFTEESIKNVRLFDEEKLEWPLKPAKVLALYGEPNMDSCTEGPPISRRYDLGNSSYSFSGEEGVITNLSILHR
jgi:hypothetical protein